MSPDILKQFIHHCIEEDPIIQDMQETLRIHTGLFDKILVKLTNMEEAILIAPKTLSRHGKKIYDHEKRLKKLESSN